MVHCKKSKIEGAGDGLFASRDIPSGIIVSYYNGLRIESDQNYSPDNSNYQIYVDWENTDGSAYVDIPIQCIDYENYRASLAHKANHSFTPNCKFIAVGTYYIIVLPNLYYKYYQVIPKYNAKANL